MDLTKLLLKDVKKEVIKESQKEQYLDEKMLELTNIAVKEANSNSGKSFNLKQFLYDKESDIIDPCISQFRSNLTNEEYELRPNSTYLSLKRTNEFDYLYSKKP